MIDSESSSFWNAMAQAENLTPPKVMPWGHRKLLKDELNGDAALDTAGTAKEGVLQRLEVPKRDNGCCISWGPDFTTVRGTRLQDGLLQPVDES